MADTLSVDQFAAKIKAKYPDYANIDNTELVNRIVTKYPDYRSQVDLSSSNAGLAGVAKPNVDMNTSGLATAYGFGKGAAGATARATFGADALGSGQLPQASSEEIAQHQPFSSFLKQSSAANVPGNITGDIGTAGQGIKQSLSTPEGAGETAANLAMMISGGRQIGKEILPSKQRAGALFNQASAAAGGSAIDLTAPGNIALDMREAAQSGGRLPKVIRDFITRSTDPNRGPITYDEARQFYQNAGSLAVNERNGLNASMQRQLNQFRSALGQSIQQTAEQAGVGEQYAGAMSQYKSAARLSDAADFAKSKIVPAVAKGAAGAIGATSIGGPLFYLWKKYLSGE